MTQETIREARVAFQDVRFRRKDAATIRGLLLGRYWFDIPDDEIACRVGEFRLEDGAFVFPGIDENHAWKRFNPLLKAWFDRLRHINYDKPTVYIHRNSGIPLIGTNEFGLVDRGSNIIEVKPLTGCNFQCNYCSVDEGKNDKTHDYVVEEEYLAEEAAKLAARKGHPVEFNIGPQGEPFLYPKLVELVRDLKAVPDCAIVSVNTNGSLLTEAIIDQLAEAGLTRINLSLNALSQETANALAGRSYPIAHVRRMIAYAQGKIGILLAPTIVPGFNDDQIEPLVSLGTTIRSDFPTMGFQNYLHYSKGRIVAPERSFDEFFAMLKPLEAKYGIKLTGFTKEDFRIFDEPEPEKPMRKGDILKVRVAMPARYPNEIIGVARDRCVTIVGSRAHELQVGKSVSVRIIRDKHNIYKGTML